MHLGFHYHIPGFEKNGKIYTMAFQGLFIDSLAEHCDHLTIFLYKPTSTEYKELDYEIKSSNVSLVSFMKHYKIPIRILLYPGIRKKIKAIGRTVDVLLIRAPTPLLPLITKDIRKMIPYSYLVVGEMSKHVDDIKQKEWRKELIRTYVRWNEGKQEKLAKDALIFANSAVTYEKYSKLSQNCVQVRTTTLKKENFFYRDNTCTGPVIEVLFTGRIEQDKGILEITEAIGKLNSAGIDCRLNIVGWIVPNDPIETMVLNIADHYHIHEKVIFHGFKTAGEELFEYYKKADIFIVASQNNEGFPRTIWEALAHSVPVVCTAVGSIPSFLQNEKDALFIERKNAEDIYLKLKRLISDPDLRKRLISNGLETVKDVTLEIQSKKMIDALEKFISV